MECEEFWLSVFRRLVKEVELELLSAGLWAEKYVCFHQTQPVLLLFSRQQRMYQVFWNSSIDKGWDQKLRRYCLFSTTSNNVKQFDFCCLREKARSVRSIGAEESEVIKFNVKQCFRRLFFIVPFMIRTSPSTSCRCCHCCFPCSDMINFPCFSEMFLSISDVTFYSFFILASPPRWLILILSPLGRAKIALIAFAEREWHFIWTRNGKTEQSASRRRSALDSRIKNNKRFFASLLCCNTWCCTIQHNSSRFVFVGIVLLLFLSSSWLLDIRLFTSSFVQSWGKRNKKAVERSSEKKLVFHSQLHVN